jgi:nucleotide-binding universal stress UspA family protein
MFKHILLPTDGSATSRVVIQKVVQFAKETGASITAVHVTPEFHLLGYQPELMMDTPAQFRSDSEAHARRLLLQVEAVARDAGVACDSAFYCSDQPYDVIVKAALDKGCDLICMASHGHKGIKALLLGSETQKVLTHSSLPVLVFR